MTTRSLGVLMLMLGLAGLSAGCGAGGDSPGGGADAGTSGSRWSCYEPKAPDSTQNTVCAEYAGVTAAETAQGEVGCNAGHGTFGDQCPTANLLGCCKTTGGNRVQSNCYYNDGASTAAELMTACASVSASSVWSTTP